MNNYSWTIEYTMKLTRNQLILFKKRIEDRIIEDRKFNAKLHNFKIKENGLDTNGAIPIETIIDCGKNNI